MRAEFQPDRLSISGRFMVGDKKAKQKKSKSIELMASLAPAQAEVEAWVLAKAD